MNINDHLKKAIDKFETAVDRIDELENEVANFDAKAKQPVTTKSKENNITDFKLKEFVASGVTDYKNFTKGLATKGLVLNGNGAMYEAQLNTLVLEQAIQNDAILNAIGSRVTENLDYRRTVLSRRPAVALTHENTAFADVVKTDSQNYTSIPALYTKLYSYPWVTHEALEQSDVNVQANLVKLLAEQFSITMQDQFLHGDGAKGSVQHLRGITNAAIDRANNYTEALKPAATRDRETFAAVKTGSAATIGSTATEIEANLYNLMLAVPQRSQANAKFAMNEKTLSFLMQNLKDSQGRSLIDIEIEKSFSVWTRRITLFGAEIILNETIDDIGANNAPIIFGDFKSGYERLTPTNGAHRFTIDFITTPDVTKFYMDQYVGSTVADHEALSVLVCIG